MEFTVETMEDSTHLNPPHNYLLRLTYDKQKSVDLFLTYLLSTFHVKFLPSVLLTTMSFSVQRSSK